MVLSLVNLALSLILNGIKNGSRIQNPQMLSPKLRQLIMDTALKRGMVDDPNCLAFLTSSEFLNGMTSINYRIDSYYTYQFFHRLEESMVTALPNGEKMDAAFTKLHLTDFGCYLLKREGDFKRVLENLIGLSISVNWEILDNGRHIVNFKQLSILKLDNCGVDIDLWPEFLRQIPTLEDLQMINVKVGWEWDRNMEVLDKFLPFSMPHLKSLEIVGKKRWWLRFNCNKAFVDNLIGCPKLRQLHLTLDESSTDEASLIRLANMNINMKIEARFIVYGNADIVTSESKLVRIFREKVDSMDLFFEGEWKPHFSAALEDVVNKCLNLTKFHIAINEAIAISDEDMKRINSALVQFFDCYGRPLKLKDLSLKGNFNEAVVSTVFERCLNLVQLEVSSCPVLRDQHLIDWVDRYGGKLSEFNLTGCQNITSEGIIPILVKSAEELLRYNFGVRGRNWKGVLKHHCPNAQPSFWKLENLGFF